MNVSRNVAIAFLCVGSLGGCSSHKAEPTLSVCQAVESGPQLERRHINIRGWYGSASGYWSALGQRERCGLILPEFQIGLPVKFTRATTQEQDDIGRGLEMGLGTAWDFRATFHGILKRREFKNGGALGADELPGPQVMGYVLEIDRVDDVNVEKAAWKPEPSRAAPNPR